MAYYNILLRGVQFDLRNTDPAMTITFPITHDEPSTPIEFWDCGSTPACQSDAAFCGSEHFIDDDIAGGRISIDYVGLDADSTVQVVLPGGGTSLHVGMLKVTLPVAPGHYMLDLMNADDPSKDSGAICDFGFELPDDPVDPRTVWRAYTGELSGGTLEMEVGEEPEGACCYTDGTCEVVERHVCLDQDGTPNGPGSACAGDTDHKRIDDACEQYDFVLHEVQTYIGFEPQKGDRLGTSVSISGDKAVVGAVGRDCQAGDECGTAYVLDKNQGGPDNWGQVAKLTASDGAPGDRFGISVSINGRLVVPEKDAYAVVG